MSLDPRLVMTQEDHTQLTSLLLHARSEVAELLEEELDRADIVSQRAIPSDVVTMRSTIRFEDAATGAESEVTLVYPHEADPSRGRVSVLAPVGAALIGMRVGSAIDWPVPGGRVRTLRITAVVYQPEASGHWHL